MWSRCWWATWLSGFFGIAGLLHLLRLAAPFELSIAGFDVPLPVTAGAGAACLMLSAGLLLLEVRRERRKRAAEAREPSVGPWRNIWWSKSLSRTRPRPIP